LRSGSVIASEALRRIDQGRRGAALCIAGLVGTAIGGCATTPESDGHDAHLLRQGWQQVRLPGKRPTDYRWVADKDGAGAVQARAQASASMLRRPLRRDGASLREVEFAWMAHALPADGDVSDADHEDASARVVLAFDGDPRRLSARNRMLFDLAHSLTGEAPPFATLMYVWDVRAPVDRIVVNPRSDRIRKIVVESGPTNLGAWRRYRRSVAQDFQRAFGEPPGDLLAVGLMTDGDNTGARLATWYRDVIVR
jgi:Protein of unknown function (DUF3047)